MPFGAVGAATFPVENDAQAREQAQIVIKENFAVILLHEALAQTLAPIFEKLQDVIKSGVVECFAQFHKNQKDKRTDDGHGQQRCE